MTLDQRIEAGREQKARRYARALWNGWDDAERAGLGVRALRRQDRAFWTQLADSLGERAPSEETVALITEKLDTATTLYRSRS